MHLIAGFLFIFYATGHFPSTCTEWLFDNSGSPGLGPTIVENAVATPRAWGCFTRDGLPVVTAH